jgi:hypothetical protein
MLWNIRHATGLRSYTVSWDRHEQRKTNMKIKIDDIHLSQDGVQCWAVVFLFIVYLKNLSVTRNVWAPMTDINWKGFERNRSWPNLSCYPGIALREWKITEYILQPKSKWSTSCREVGNFTVWANVLGAGYIEQDNGFPGFIQDGEFLVELSDLWLRKEELAPCN